MRSLGLYGVSSFLLAGVRAFHAFPGFARALFSPHASSHTSASVSSIPGSASPSALLRCSGQCCMTMNATKEKGEEVRDQHKPAAVTGHRARSPEQRSPEDEALWARIQEYQQSAARLSKTEEGRNLIQYSTGFGVLSTNSRSLQGYPGGSVVGFSLDEKGRPLFAFSSMSAHTGDLAADGRASLTVTAASFKGAADGRMTLMGDVRKVAEGEYASVRDMYRTKHPNAYWVDFEDFSWMRMDSIKAIRFIGGFAMAGDIDPADYVDTAPDPVAEFSPSILQHMNRDHPAATKSMVEHYITGGFEVSSALVTAVDHLGIYVLVAMKDGQSRKLRLPFPRPAKSRKDVKTLIMEMTNASTPAFASAAESRNVV